MYLTRVLLHVLLLLDLLAGVYWDLHLDLLLLLLKHGILWIAALSAVNTAIVHTIGDQGQSALALDLGHAGLHTRVSLVVLANDLAKHKRANHLLAIFKLVLLSVLLGKQFESMLGSSDLTLICDGSHAIHILWQGENLLFYWLALLLVNSLLGRLAWYYTSEPNG